MIPIFLGRKLGTRFVLDPIPKHRRLSFEFAGFVARFDPYEEMLLVDDWRWCLWYEFDLPVGYGAFGRHGWWGRGEGTRVKRNDRSEECTVVTSRSNAR